MLKTCISAQSCHCEGCRREDCMFWRRSPHNLANHQPRRPNAEAISNGCLLSRFQCMHLVAHTAQHCKRVQLGQLGSTLLGRRVQCKAQVLWHQATILSRRSPMENCKVQSHPRLSTVAGSTNQSESSQRSPTHSCYRRSSQSLILPTADRHDGDPPCSGPHVGGQGLF